MNLEQYVTGQQPPAGKQVYQDTAERIKKYCSRLWASKVLLSTSVCKFNNKHYSLELLIEFANLTTFIHSSKIHIAPLQGNYSEALLTPVRAKR